MNIKKILFLSLLTLIGVFVTTNVTNAAMDDGICNSGDVTITAPASGSAVKGTVTVGWTFNGTGADCNTADSSVFSIEVSHDSGAIWTSVGTSSLPSSTSATFDSTLAGTPDDTDYQFRLNKGGSIIDATSYSDVAIDNTAPVLLSAVTADDNGNGAIDRIRVALTEATSGMASTCSTTGWTVTADDTTVLTVSACTRIDSTHLDLTITEDATHAKTDNTPSVAYAASGDTADRAGNEITAASIAGAADESKPAIISAVTGDVDNNGQIDRLVLTFSEQVDIVDAGGDGFPAITLSGSYVIPDHDYTASDATTLTLIITESGSVDTATVITPTYSTAGEGSIIDNETNEMAEVETVTGDDGVKPIIISAVTGDNDGNGKIDRLVLTFSEQVDIVDANAGDGFDGVTLSGGYVIDNGLYGATDATTLTLTITEGAVNTGAIIDPTYTTAGSNTIIDNATNEMNNTETVTGTDGAYPVIVNSAGSDSDNDGKTNSYTITFSENLTDGGAAGANVNFTARNGTTHEDIAITTVGIGLTGAGDATQVVLNLDDTDTDNYTGVIQFSYDNAGGGVKIEDASTGTLDFADQTNTALIDDVKPVLLSSRGGNTGGTADVLNNAGEIIDFRFSETMNATLPTIAQLESGLIFAAGDVVEGDNLGATNTVSQVTLVLPGDTYRVTWTVNSTNPITPGTDTVQVTTGTNIKDAQGITANTAPAAVTISVADITAPTISSRLTQDLDKDGQIDAIKITFSENIADSTVRF